MKVHLKVKIKSLAAEAAIIRHQERRYRKDSHVRLSLRHHRVHAVRRESRCAGLAYGFLRGRPYRSIENARTRSTPDWKRIEKLVLGFGEADMRDLKQRFSEWKDAA